MSGPSRWPVDGNPRCLPPFDAHRRLPPRARRFACDFAGLMAALVVGERGRRLAFENLRLRCDAAAARPQSPRTP
jgi:hypothetical protein